MQLTEEVLDGLAELLEARKAGKAAAVAPAPAADAEITGLGGVLHLILDHIHVPEDIRARAHTAVDALAEASGEVADTVAPEVEAKPEGA